MAEDGVTIEFLSKERLTDEENFEDKLDFVLGKVKENAVLVLEEAWLPEEKRELIQKSVEEADEDFPGVEFMGFDAEESRIDKMKSMFYDRFLNEQYRRGLTIVGNSRVMEKIKEEPDTVSFLAKMEEEN
jgi:hypothetical protein